MKSNILRVAWLLNLILVTLLATQVTAATLSNQQQVDDCKFVPPGEWWNKDFSSLPANVKDNIVTGEPEFCEFYQFSQAYFMYMISLDEKGQPNFLDQAQFPLLETDGSNSCDETAPQNAFNVRSVKSPGDSSPFVLPERIDQASANAIFDQNGNVVFYEVRFSKNLCDYESILSKPNFPGKTIELKMAWKVLEDTDNAANFYHIDAKINGNPYKLGLAGLHLAVGADNHPEMVWITVEQNNNTIACDKIGANQTAQSFISESCATDVSKCQGLNDTLETTVLKLPEGEAANDICEVYPYGTPWTEDINTRDGLNIQLLTNLNNELQTVFGSKKPSFPETLSVWKNYHVKGALWVSEIEQDSGNPDSADTNERGSLELANTVMETEFQGEFNGSGTSLNCFVCHEYTGSDNFKSDGSNWNTTVSSVSKTAGLSHIFDDIIQGQKQDKD